MADCTVKILIVDDEDIIRKNVVSKVKRLQHGRVYEIYEARSAEEAEDVYKKIRPGIVITDIRMQRRTGLNLAKTIRAVDSDCIIFILSGHDDFDYVRDGFRAGINDYLLKPLAFSELDAKLREYVEAEPPHLSLEEAAQSSSRRQTIEEYIDANLSRGPSMSECADLCGMSYSHFSRVFKEIFQCPWSQYVNRKRMATAAELLRDDSARINEIAAKVGYDDPNHFSRTFQRVYGVYPSEFRKRRTDT